MTPNPDMPDSRLTNLLDGKSDDSRAAIALRVGQSLSVDSLPEADRRGAEMLARALAQDAIERVRIELSKAVARALYLPRDVALKIAHDVDSVACPFLELTEVFSDRDWQQLVLTISRGARVAVARRSSMSDALALTLSELGDSVVVETLVANPAAPMTEPVCRTLMDRFESQTWILDGLAERNDLIEQIAIDLTAKISAAAREKLLGKHGMPDFIEPVGAEAEIRALLKVIRETADARLPGLVQNLTKDGRLTDLLLLAAARENLQSFLGAALSARAGVRLNRAQSIVARGGAGPVIQLFRQAGIPNSLHDDFWDALMAARSGANDGVRAASA